MSRVEKVEHAIQRELSSLLLTELKDPRVGFVTITRVEMSADLRNAKIFYSVLGAEKDFKKTGEALDSATGFLRKCLAERIDLRYVPEIIFREDHSSEYSVHIQEVLEEIRGHDEPVKNPAKNKKSK